jgi:hypothetical protein
VEVHGGIDMSGKQFHALSHLQGDPGRQGALRPGEQAVFIPCGSIADLRTPFEFGQAAIDGKRFEDTARPASGRLMTVARSVRAWAYTMPILDIHEDK